MPASQPACVLVSDQASMNCGSSAGTIENPARPRISAAHRAATTGVEGAAVAHLLYAKSPSGCSGACSSTMSCSMLRTRKPPAVTNAASISNPYEKLPVASLIRPIKQRATNAPRAATELMKAMPTAADGPVRKFGASVQNTGDDAYTPIAESVKQAILSTGWLTNAAGAMPRAAK